MSSDLSPDFFQFFLRLLVICVLSNKMVQIVLYHINIERKGFLTLWSAQEKMWLLEWWYYYYSRVDHEKHSFGFFKTWTSSDPLWSWISGKCYPFVWWVNWNWESSKPTHRISEHWRKAIIFSVRSQPSHEQLTNANIVISLCDSAGDCNKDMALVNTKTTSKRVSCMCQGFQCGSGS